MGRPRKYFTEEEKKAAQREASKRYYTKNKEKIAEKKAEYDAKYRQNNKEKIAKQKTEYRENNKEKFAEYEVKYRLTPKGRANNLLKAYRQTDKKYNRGECTLTADWIIQNIFSKPCHYCGKTDWKELGCDRIDNSLPHRPDNVVPCCDKCNKKRGTTPFDEYLKLVGKSNTD